MYGSGVWVFRLMTFGKDQKGDQGGGPKMAKIFGWGKKSRFWASSSAKKVLLTAEKMGSTQT